MATLADSSTKPRTKSVHSTSSKCFMRSWPSGAAQTHARSQASPSLFGVCAARSPEPRTRPCYKGPLAFVFDGPQQLVGLRVEPGTATGEGGILTFPTRPTLGMEPPEHARDSRLAIRRVNTFVRYRIAVGCDAAL